MLKYFSFFISDIHQPFCKFTKVTFLGEIGEDKDGLAGDIVYDVRLARQARAQQLQQTHILTRTRNGKFSWINIMYHCPKSS